MKAATRLRRMECRTGLVVLTVKGEGGDGATPGRWSHGRKLVAAMDSFTLLAVLDDLWARMRVELPDQRYRQVSVTFLELTAAAETQLALFDAAPAVTAAIEARRLALSAAIDRMNVRFGRDAVTVGHDSAGASRSSGPRIAFTRDSGAGGVWSREPEEVGARCGSRRRGASCSGGTKSQNRTGSS